MAIVILNGKSVFITGAASGIGAATSKAFAKQGAKVLMSDLNAQGLEQVAEDIARSGGQTQSWALDVTNEEAYQGVVDEICVDHGVPHVVMNNAGLGYLGPFLDTPPEAFRKVIEVNLFGVVNGCRAWLGRLVEAGDARHLVNVASGASVTPLPNMSAYAASKYGVHGLSYVLGMELEKTNVSVTSVHPGIINTPIVANESGVAASFPKENLKKLQTYYAEKGCDPEDVAQGIIDAVKTDQRELFVGPRALSSALLKRFMPEMARKLILNAARETGYQFD